MTFQIPLSRCSTSYLNADGQPNAEPINDISRYIKPQAEFVALDRVLSQFLYSASPSTILSNSGYTSSSTGNFPPSLDPGRLLALDIGGKRVGVAVSDESRLSVRPLPTIQRQSWKKLLKSVIELIVTFDAKAVVLGLPLRLDGSEGDAAAEIRRLFGNFQASLEIPVFLQDERLTSQAAEANLAAEGRSREEIRRMVDGEAAVLILQDFISGLTPRPII
jgi:putative Holliday junction resolvase